MCGAREERDGRGRTPEVHDSLLCDCQAGVGVISLLCPRRQVISAIRSRRGACGLSRLLLFHSLPVLRYMIYEIYVHTT